MTAPRQRLVIHAGTHKTGSTAVQSWAALNRMSLRACGVYYPRPEQGVSVLRASHREIVDTARDGRGQEDPRAVAALLERYTTRIERSGAPVTLLSAEGLSAISNGFAKNFAPLAERFDIQVVIFLRRADAYLEGFYKQKIKLGQPLRPFPQHLEAHLPRLARHRQVPLRRWAEVLGQSAVTVIPYEPAVPGFDVTARLILAAGLPGRVARLPRWDRFAPNPSLTRAQAEVLRRINLTGHTLSARQLRRLRRAVTVPGAGYLSAPSRARVLDTVAEADAAICRMFVRDGRDTLYPQPPERVHDLEQDWDGTLPPELMPKLERLLGLPQQDMGRAA